MMVDYKDTGISIHALRAEGDVEGRKRAMILIISIHALRAEGDVWTTPYLERSKLFQSTPSVRRATHLLQKK